MQNWTVWIWWWKGQMNEAAEAAPGKRTKLQLNRRMAGTVRQTRKRNYWAGQKNLVKGCRETLECYCVSCELLYAPIADALLFVNISVSGIFHGRVAQQLAVNKPCLQIIRCLLWKQTTTHILCNNNPMFHANLWPGSFDQPSTYDQTCSICDEGKKECSFSFCLDKEKVACQLRSEHIPRREHMLHTNGNILLRKLYYNVGLDQILWNDWFLCLS